MRPRCRSSDSCAGGDLHQPASAKPPAIAAGLAAIAHAVRINPVGDLLRLARVNLRLVCGKAVREGGEQASRRIIQVLRYRLHPPAGLMPGGRQDIGLIAQIEEIAPGGKGVEQAGEAVDLDG